MQRRGARFAARTAVLVFVVACAPASSGSATAATPTRSTSSFLIADDLRRTDVLNAGDAIRRLRPQWPRRGNANQASTTGLSASPAEPVVVWIDNNRAGDLEVLDQVPVTKVRSVQFFSSNEAEARFGSGVARHVTRILLAPARRVFISTFGATMPALRAS